MKNKFTYRVLAGALAVLLTFQGVSLPTFAEEVEEGTDVVEITEVLTQTPELTVEVAPEVPAEEPETELPEEPAQTPEDLGEVESEEPVEEPDEEPEGTPADEVEPEVPAEEPEEEPEVLTLHDGTVFLFAETDVKQALYNALVSGGSADAQSIEWEYKCKGKTSVGIEGNESWGPIGGFETSTKVLFTTTKYTHPALKDNKDGNYQIRIAGTTAEVTVTKASKHTSSIEVTGNTAFAMPYNEDGGVNFAALKEAILALVTVSPAEATDKLTVQYYATAKTGVVKAWVGLEGGTANLLQYPAISAGEQQIKVSFAGNDTYASASKDFTVTLEDLQSATIELTTTNFALPYNEDLSVDYAALEAAILAAVETNVDGLTVKYQSKANADLTGLTTAWVNLAGEKINISTYPAISAGAQKIQITFAGNNQYAKTVKEFDVTIADREAASIVLKDAGSVKLPYNEDGSANYEALKANILALVDYEASTAGIEGNLSVKYEAHTVADVANTGLGKQFANLEGEKIGLVDFRAITEGSQKIKLTFAGNQNVAKTEYVFTIEVVGREDATISLFNAESVKLPYNEDGSANYEALKANILALVNYEASTAGIEGNLSVKYEAYTVLDLANTGAGKQFANLEGEKINLVDYRAITEGSQKIKLTFAGNAEHKETSAEFVITVVGRENVTINVKETPDTVAMVFANDDLDYDYAAIEAAVWNAVVEGTDPALTAADVTVAYSANPLYKGATDAVSLAAANFQPLDYKATVLGQDLLAFGAGERYVRISYAGNTEYNAFSFIAKINVTEPERLESVIILNAGVSTGYSSDAEVIRQAVMNNMVNWEGSTLPENVDWNRFVVEYWANPDIDNLPADLLNLIKGLGQEDNIDKLLSGAATWAPLEGGVVNGIKLFGKEFGLTYAQISAGEQKIRVSYKGNKDYMPSAAEGTLNITKASVKVTVHSNNIFAGDPIPAGFITTNPADKFDIYTVYAGITSNVTTSVFVTMPDRLTSNSTVLTILDKALELIGQKTFTQIMQEGVTVGELRNLLNTQQFLDALKFVGIDLGSLGQLLETINKLPAIGDNIRIAFGTPDQAGLYTVAAITSNKNYKTGVGVGFLLVKMRTSGVKLVWNSSSNKFTAEEVANGADLGATLTCNGEAVKDQSAVKYLYTGIQSNWRPYSSTKAPTQPGSYIVTATIIGGNYMAAPATRTFKITK